MRLLHGKLKTMHLAHMNRIKACQVHENQRVRELDHVELGMGVLDLERLEMRDVARETLLMVHCDRENP